MLRLGDSGRRVEGVNAHQLAVGLLAGLEEDHSLTRAGVDYLVACSGHSASLFLKVLVTYIMRRGPPGCIFPSAYFRSTIGTRLLRTPYSQKSTSTSSG